jgi:hypothetical protein
MRRKKTHVFNACNMPQTGVYILERLDAATFAAAIREAAQNGRIVSSLGYQVNAEIIEQMSGIALPVSVRRIELKDADDILAMRLKYDPQRRPGQRDISGPEDFEFFKARYYEALPILPRVIAESIDPEPLELAFLKRYLELAYSADWHELDDLDRAWEAHSAAEPEDPSAEGWERWEAENDGHRIAFWAKVFETLEGKR